MGTFVKRGASHLWWGIALFCILCLLQSSPLFVNVMSLSSSGWKALPGTTNVSSVPVSRISADLDGDGEEECVDLSRGRLKIFACGSSTAPLWQSPVEWEVTDWTFSDLNHDGSPEVTLVVWRKFAPWPIDVPLPSGGGRISSFHDRRGNSCHVILIGWKKGGYRELWAGSALYQPVISLDAADVNADGADELITIEGEYSQARPFRSRPLAVWKWNGFGFDLYARFDGAFRHVRELTNFPGWMVVSQ